MYSRMLYGIWELIIRITAEIHIKMAIIMTEATAPKIIDLIKLLLLSLKFEK